MYLMIMIDLSGRVLCFDEKVVRYGPGWHSSFEEQMMLILSSTMDSSYMYIVFILMKML